MLRNFYRKYFNATRNVQSQCDCKNITLDNQLITQQLKNIEIPDACFKPAGYMVVDGIVFPIEGIKVQQNKVFLKATARFKKQVDIANLEVLLLEADGTPVGVFDRSKVAPSNMVKQLPGDGMSFYIELTINAKNQVA